MTGTELRRLALGLLTLLGLTIALPGAAQQKISTLDTYAARWIKPLIARHATVRLVTCFYPVEAGHGAIAAIYFVRGERSGVYLLFDDDGTQEQGATISRLGVPDLNEMMGGA